MFSSKYLFLLLVACTSAVAVNYNIEKTPGKPVLLHFKDGRIADLLFERSPVISAMVPAEISENTCTGKLGKLCTFKTSAALMHFEVKWSTHPDAAKIGKGVYVRYQGPGSSPFPIRLPFFLFSGEKFLRPVASKFMPNDSLS